MSGRVAACQFEPTVGDVPANVARIDELVGRLDPATDLAVLPELCVTGYDLSAAVDAAAPVPGRRTDRLAAVAADHDVAMAVGLPERADGRVFNSYLLVDGDGVVATYRKRRLWGDEAGTFERGDNPVTAETPVGRVGFLVCYDLNFPEYALEYAHRDCDVVVVGSAWRASFRADWRLLSRARALDGQYYVVGANHTGSQGDRHHAGRSLVAGPRGEVVAAAGTGAGAITAVVDEADLREARRRTPVRRTRADRT